MVLIQGLPFLVLFPVVLDELAGFDLAPPPFVIFIPLHCERYTLIPIHFGLPSERIEFARIDRVLC